MEKQSESRRPTSSGLARTKGPSAAALPRISPLSDRNRGRRALRPGLGRSVSDTTAAALSGQRAQTPGEEPENRRPGRRGVEEQAAETCSSTSPDILQRSDALVVVACAEGAPGRERRVLWVEDHPPDGRDAFDTSSGVFCVTEKLVVDEKLGCPRSGGTGTADRSRPLFGQKVMRRANWIWRSVPRRVSVIFPAWPLVISPLG